MFSFVATKEYFTYHPVQVTYDPKVVSYDQLLDVFFDRTDPTTKNRQGNDSGELAPFRLLDGQATTFL
jgi:peptide-methionine (S)-S-oxide reductase